MSEIAAVPIEYKSFLDERAPKIGVYYTFKRYPDFGLCKEFKIDIQRLIRTRKQVIGQLLDYEFLNEKRFLDSLIRNKVQAIKTEVPDRINFFNLAEVIARIHFDEFVERHEWLRRL